MTESNKDPISQWLTFILNNEIYGIDVQFVQEVLRPPEISIVPGAPAHILGIINVRGEFISVSDIRTLLNLSKVNITDQTRVILIDLNGQKFGILVDSIAEIIDVRSSEIESINTGDNSSNILGTCQKKDNLFILLSINELLKE
ncbi:MAG: chemotaxis protein CheW [Bacteroidota bacterium]